MTVLMPMYIYARAAERGHKVDVMQFGGGFEQRLKHWTLKFKTAHVATEHFCVPLPLTLPEHGREVELQMLTSS